MDSADINSKLSLQDLTSNISETNAEKPAPTNSNLNEEWLEIGKILAPQGLDGQVRVYPTSDFPERFLQPGERWILRSADMKPQPIELLGGRYLEGKGLYVLELAQVENRSQAEALRGCKLLVPASDRPILGEDEYHVLDLIGLEVFNQLTQELLGKVIDVIAAGNDLLEVQLQQVSAIASNQQDKETREEPVFQETKPNKGKRKSKSSKSNTVLIPFVKAIVPVVDIENRRVEITPPPGLLEINLDPSKVI